MSKTVWKFALGRKLHNIVEMPAGAVLVDVAIQPDDVIYVWAIVDPETPRVRRMLGLVATGEMVDEASYVGSVHGQDRQGGSSVVLHLFDFGEA